MGAVSVDPNSSRGKEIKDSIILTCMESWKRRDQRPDSFSLGILFGFRTKHMTKQHPDKTSDHLGQGSVNFFFKGWIVNILDVAGPKVSVAITQLCSCSVKAATGDT